MSDDTQLGTEGRAPDGLRFAWPYLAFILFVAVYSLLFLADGFNATDEGYLQSLATRIVGGEQPYADYYFFRTPLSIYIQTGLIRLFEDDYTILAARWFWTIQMVILVIMVSLLYYRYVTRLELWLLLTTTWVVTSLLIAFPWYSYDAVFFAVLALLLVHKRVYFWAGVAMFLAGMSKQNYFLLLPGFLLAAGLSQWRWPRAEVIRLASSVRLTAGFVIPSLIYLGYLHFYGGGLELFAWNVFVMPRDTSQITLTFAVFQNNGEALLNSLPLTASIVIWSFGNLRKKIWVALALLLAAVAVVHAFSHYRTFIWELVYLNYTLIAVAAVRTFSGEPDTGTRLFHRLLPAITMGIVIQYLAGFNYGGLFFSYMGAAPAMAIGWVLFRMTDPSALRRVVSLALLVVVMGIGLFCKYDYVARDDKRHRLDTEFTTHKLAGIRSTNRNVCQIESMISAIEQHTQPGDYILALPDFPCIYYLSARRNPTRIGWYLMKEYTLDMLGEALGEMDRNPPQLVLLQTYSENDFLRQRDPPDYWNYRRYAPLYAWLRKNYRFAGMAGDVSLMVPKDTGP